MRKILKMLVPLIFASHVSAMDFGQLGGTFTMHGEIKKDDSVNFIISLASWDNPPTVFHITSTGGDLDEAMKIGEIIRSSQIPVWSGEECFSACVFIYASGVERDAQGKVGLHRPYFDKKYFANLSSLEAKEKYEELKQQSITYLKEIEVSQALIDRMFQTGSTEVDIIEAEEANRLFGAQSPFYEEWITAKCGKYTEEQSRVLTSWGSLQAARATLAMAKDESIPKSDNFGSNLQELVEGAQLALQMEKAGMLEPYIELSEIHQKCEEKAANAHVYSFHRSLQKYFLDLSREIEPNNRVN